MVKMILAIDDEKSMLAFYQVALAEYGQVRTASGMKEARTQYDGLDLIILDCYMEDEQDTLQNRLAELTKVAPVLICSGVMNPMVQAIGQANGATGFWQKSKDVEGLHTLVKAVLSKQA